MGERGFASSVGNARGHATHGCSAARELCIYGPKSKKNAKVALFHRLFPLPVFALYRRVCTLHCPFPVYSRVRERVGERRREGRRRLRERKMERGRDGSIRLRASLRRLSGGAVSQPSPGCQVPWAMRAHEAWRRASHAHARDLSTDVASTRARSVTNNSNCACAIVLLLPLLLSCI